MSPISAHDPLAVFPGNVHCHKTLSLVLSIAWEFIKVKGRTVFWVDIRTQGNN
jgi:hypothetical protein